MTFILPMLVIVSAYLAEARFFVQQFEAQPIAAAWPIYRGYWITANLPVYIVISGQGQQVQSAVHYTMGKLDGINSTNSVSLWVNAGVAGHATLAIGEARLIKRLQTAGQSMVYPSQPYRSLLPGASLTTVDQVKQFKDETDLYDMEGYWFYQAISRYVTNDRIVCLKVVSDNRDETDLMTRPRELSRRLMQWWANSAVLQTLQAAWQAANAHHQDRSFDQTAPARTAPARAAPTRLTQTQQQQWRKLQQRAAVLDITLPTLTQDWASYRQQAEQLLGQVSLPLSYDHNG